MVKEIAWFKDTAAKLEKLKTIDLIAELIAEQVYEQKVRTHTHRHDILYSTCYSFISPSIGMFGN